MNNPKLHIINGHAYANSLDLAKHFQKRHDHVLRDISSILNRPNSGEIEDFNRVNFNAISRRDSRGRSMPVFNLTRDGFALIAMGFTGERALLWKIRYINAFNEMEAELNRRAMREQNFEQLQLRFPDVAETVAETRPSMTVTYALGRLTELGLMIPPVSRASIIGLIKRGRLDGFNDGRHWRIHADSFNRFLELRSRQTA